MIAVNQAMHLHSLIAPHRLLADTTDGTHRHTLHQAFQGSLKWRVRFLYQFFFGGPFGGEDFLPENNPYEVLLGTNEIFGDYKNGIWSNSKTEDSRLVHLKIIQLEASRKTNRKKNNRTSMTWAASKW